MRKLEGCAAADSRAAFWRSREVTACGTLLGMTGLPCPAWTFLRAFCEAAAVMILHAEDRTFRAGLQPGDCAAIYRLTAWDCQGSEVLLRVLFTYGPSQTFPPRILSGLLFKALGLDLQAKQGATQSEFGIEALESVGQRSGLGSSVNGLLQSDMMLAATQI